MERGAALVTAQYRPHRAARSLSEVLLLLGVLARSVR